MKKTLAIVLAIFMIVSTIPMAFAATEVANGTAGEGITWVLDSDGTLTVSGTGVIVVDWYAPPWKDYNESITSVVVEEGITKIPDTAFAYAENLVTVSVPSTVTYIGTTAFWFNYSLESINVAEENTTYKDIDGVLFTEDEKTLVAYPANKSGTEYTIPASVTTIGECAFSFNISLESLTIPDTVTTLGTYTFENSYLDTIIVGNGITEIPTGCFARASVKTVVISDSVKAINYAAFWAATELETLIIGSGVETVADDILGYTSQLSVVHYKGTQETWDAISINEENADLNSKTLHFLSDDAYKAQVAPTCADGHTAGYYCDDCEAYLTGEVIPAVDEHTPGAELEENVVAPDCTTAGSKDIVTYCTVCGEETSRETVETAEALGHTPGAEAEENIVASTCTTAGSKDIVTYCTVCGEEASRETVETAAALGHDWNNSVCGTCGETCAHDDDDYDEICDECGAEVPITEAKLDETNTVYIPKEHADVVVKFTPTETGDFVIISDNGGDDDNIDPYVDVYDSNGDNIASDDDNDYVNTYNFYCIFRAEAGETYYIELSCHDGDVEYDYTIEKYVEIAHQPTSGEPYVELNWDVDADYQWYSVESEDAEVTDENAEAYSYDDATATYDSENGWTPIVDADGYQSSATLELKEGDTVVVEFAEDGFGYCGFWDWDEYHEGGGCNENVGVLTYKFTMDADGVYTLYTNYSVAHKIYLVSATYTAIDGATDAVYAATEDGIYACEVTFADGTTEMSDTYEGIHAHDYDSVVTTPTCEDTGYTTYTCACGDTYTANEVPATGHTEETLNAVAPTCTEKGLTEGKKCSVCGEILTAQTEIEAKGHSYNAVVTPPTESDRGYTTYTCSVCGDSYVGDYVNAFGYADRFSIRTPTIYRIRYGDTIVLHADFNGELPEGAYVKWTADNENFQTTDLGEGKFELVPKVSGDTTFTATLYDANNNVLATDSIVMTARAGIIDKIVGFINYIFGCTVYYEY